MVHRCTENPARDWGCEWVNTHNVCDRVNVSEPLNVCVCVGECVCDQLNVLKGASECVNVCVSLGDCVSVYEWVNVRE